MPVTPRKRTRRHVIEPLSYTEAAQSPALKGMMSFLDITPETIRKGHYPDVSASLLAADFTGSQIDSELLTGGESPTVSVANRAGPSSGLVSSEALTDSH